MSGSTGVAGAIVDCSREPASDLLCDVVIVGSGPAGATAAWDLAKAGREVVVLEEGGDFTGDKLTQRDARMYDQLYMERGGRTTADMSVNVLQGRVLGGGGVINACDVVPAPDGVWRAWSRRYGLTDYAPEKMAPYAARAVADLQANAPREDQVNRNNRLLRDGARALGLRGEVMRHNRVGCAGLGTCMIGCPINAKRNPRFVAIPAAIEAGARFLTRVRAVRIEDAGQEVKTVVARKLDPAGYHEGGELRVRARRVIVAGSAVSSPQLLLRSGLGNEHVGRHLSLQPQLPVVAAFPTDIEFFKGIPQTYAITEHEQLEHEEHGWWGFRVESIAATPGLTASLLPLLGSPGKALMARYAQLAAVLCLTPDAPVGRIEVERSGRLRIHYVVTPEQRSRLLAAAKVAARVFLAAGAEEVLVPVIPEVRVRSEADLARIDAIPLAPATAPLVSAHQQGGCRMAASTKDGAADPDGQVFGTRGVHVFDSSLFPTSASSHTMTPIITVAHRLADRLIAAG